MKKNIAKITYSELAAVVGVSEEELRSTQKETYKMYFKKSIPKKNGDKRVIYSLCKKLKIIQQQLLHKVLYKLPTNECLYAGKNSSTKKTMRLHLSKKKLICMDIENFFPSIKSNIIFSLLKDYGFNTEVSNAITRLTTHKKCLPQGAPTSTQLAKLVMNAPAKHIKNLFNFPVDITVWVDDLIISGPNSIENFIPSIQAILYRFGLKINDRKTLIMTSKDEQSALGIRVDGNKIRPDSDFMERFTNVFRDEPHNMKKIRSMKAYIKYVVS